MLEEKNGNTGNNAVETISILDQGCGRGYLTFSLHSHLQEKYLDQSSPTLIESRGVDVRPKLVQEISNIARSLGDRFDSLHFEQGTIEDYLLSSTDDKDSKQDDDSTNSDDANNVSSRLHVVIALHACDTATDDALWSAITRQANVIVVAPCCHKQLRPQLNRHAAANTETHPLADVWRHGIYRERLSETVTDSMRALLLELAGYNIQVFEFIGGEHTFKNSMITAVKNKKPAASPARREALIERLRALAAFHGIHEHKLAEWMQIPLTSDSTTTIKKTQPLSTHNMPPL
jgi:hypothetical protein